MLEKAGEGLPAAERLCSNTVAAKLKSTYTDKLPQMVNPHTGRVHTNYAQAVASTGRLASNDPNLQNIRCAPPKAAASARHSSRRPATS